MSLLSINDGPFLTLVALGASGMANVPFIALIAVLGPIIFGMILGNLDKKMTEFLAPGVTMLIPFVGICLGAGINISAIVTGGASGILLGLITICISGPFVVFCDRMINRRPGYAGTGCYDYGRRMLGLALCGRAEALYLPRRRNAGGYPSRPCRPSAKNNRPQGPNLRRLFLTNYMGLAVYRQYLFFIYLVYHVTQRMSSFPKQTSVVTGIS